MPPARGFQSDNASGLCPEALAALVAANGEGHAPGYGADAATARAAGAFERLFGDDVAVHFVATGTAANTLAVAALVEPWEQVACHVESHWARHESTAPERITGCRTRALGTPGSDRLAPGDLAPLARATPGDVHEPQPGVLTLSNPTELGTLYRPAELRALCERAHALGYRVHVDGARFANAVAALGCAPRALANDCGVDALSFGGTKNGLAFGEAVLFFRQGDDAVRRRASARFPFLRKSTGHLLSKHRFATAPFAAVLESGAWLRHAAHANAMAAALARGLADAGAELRHPVETNGVFARLPERVDRALRAAGYAYHPFGPPEERVQRFLCSFDTTRDDVDALVAIARAAG
ncbi:MAG: beta-eliminating lyase-related protein [Myxococcota bacterium]